MSAYKEALKVVTEIGVESLDASLEENIQKLEVAKTVLVYRKLSSKGPFGGIKTLFKKVIRKIIKFYIEPIATDQNNYNDITTECLQDMFLDMEVLRWRVKELEAANEELRKELSKQKQR